MKCKFCAFAKTQRQEDAYTLSSDELVEDAVAQYATSKFTEIHCVNGESPHVDLEFYADVLRKLRSALPDVHLKFYTASEIHHMSKLEGCSHEEVLRVLKDAGLGSLPGGGAEIFADRVRGLIAPGKEHPDEWFHVHDTAHRMGIPTHCTLLYGHVETYEERVDHLLRLRSQQDLTGGFLAFIPLAFHPENTVFERRGFKLTTGADDLKVISVARLLLEACRGHVGIGESATRLTRRERGVLSMLAEGHSYSEVGASLGVSENTVRSHVRSIYEKLGVSSKTEAVMAALRPAS